MDNHKQCMTTSLCSSFAWGGLIFDWAISVTPSNDDDKRYRSHFETRALIFMDMGISWAVDLAWVTVGFLL